MAAPANRVRGDGLDPREHPATLQGGGEKGEAAVRQQLSSGAVAAMACEERVKILKHWIKFLARATYKTNRIFNDGVKITAAPYAALCHVLRSTEA